MFSWITGPRITNAIEDIHADAGYEPTFIEQPETPAHQFAVKAFRHALFGTPAPEEANNAGKRLQKKQSPDAVNTEVPDLAAPKESGQPLSPSKQPNGILRTPKTASKAQKNVSFGAHVVDNEGKRGNVSKSGIPNDCPGKFPSPWTPGTELKVDAESGKKPQNKLTAALLDARTTKQPKSGQKPKARDDSDITRDLGAPRAESGKYWKEQYESYAERSEKEVKKLVAKQQLAKNYAKKKDGEVTELVTKLEQERKRYRRREHELEQQNKDYQERLRQAMAENFSASVEITALKNRIATLEKSMVAPSSEVFESKASFQIFEDSSKNASNPQSEQDTGPEASYLSQKTRLPPVGKENSPPKPRPVRRQTLPETSSRPSNVHATNPRLGVEPDQVSTILGKSPRASTHASVAVEKPALAPPSSDHISRSPVTMSKPDVKKENLPPKSPVAVLTSSPLPQPSPDPWMVDANESSIGSMDRMAMPMASAPSYSRSSRPSQPRRHGVSKSVSHAARTSNSKPARQTDSRSNITKADIVVPDFSTRDEKADTIAPRAASNGNASSRQSVAGRPTASQQPLPDPKFDVARITSHHAEGSSQVKRDRVEMLPVDRKAEAKRRLMERKQKKLLAS